MGKNKKIVAIFFSLGMGLNLWRKKGLLSKNLPYFRNLLGEFHQIYLFTYDREDVSFFSEPGICVFTMPISIPNIVYSLFMPFFYARKLKSVSMLHTLQMTGAIPALIGKILFRKPLLLYCGYSWSRFARYAKESLLRIFLIDLIERFAFTKADSVIVTERAHAQYALRFNRSKRVFTIPNSIDTEQFSPNGLIRTNRVVFVGRLTEQKNLFSLIEAIFRIEDVELDIIGSGEQETQLRKFVRRLGARVHFLGNMSNNKLACELPKYQALLLPSFYEGDPKVVLEAMACGVPVVASRVTGTKDLIEDKVTGILCGVDSREIIQSLKFLLANEELALRLSKNAREYVIRHRNFKINVKRQIEIIKSLLN